MAGMTMKDWIRAYIPEGKIEDNMMKVSVTQTDTFGGEANYSWANRYEFIIHNTASQRNIVRKAKALAGMTGVKSDTYDYGYIYYRHLSSTIFRKIFLITRYLQTRTYDKSGRATSPKYLRTKDFGLFSL